MATLFDHPKYIKDKLYTLNINEAIQAFRVAYKKYFGQEPTKETLCILVSHSALETGNWSKGLHCWNFGNTRCDIKTLEDGQYFTMFRCSEILKDKVTGEKKEVWFNPPQPESVFQGFLTIEDGIKHHLKFLSTKDRYKTAWSKAIAGDYKNYIDELFKGGYFTANFNLYKKVFLQIYTKMIGKIDLPEKELFSESERKNMQMLIIDSMKNN